MGKWEREGEEEVLEEEEEWTVGERGGEGGRLKRWRYRRNAKETTTQ